MSIESCTYRQFEQLKQDTRTLIDTVAGGNRNLNEKIDHLRDMMREACPTETFQGSRTFTRIANLLWAGSENVKGSSRDEKLMVVALELLQEVFPNRRVHLTLEPQLDE
jgi:hypothetical protein